MIINKLFLKKRTIWFNFSLTFSAVSCGQFLRTPQHQKCMTSISVMVKAESSKLTDAVRCCVCGDASEPLLQPILTQSLVNKRLHLHIIKSKL